MLDKGVTEFATRLNVYSPLVWIPWSLEYSSDEIPFTFGKAGRMEISQFFLRDSPVYSEKYKWFR